MFRPMVTFTVLVLAATVSAQPAPTDPLTRLMAGNARFVAGKSVHANQDRTRLTEVAKGQKPFAMLLSCADSRVPPEILFDQGLGDLFVVRVAGNIDSIIDVIAPAASRAKADPDKTDLLNKAIAENVREVLSAINKRSPALTAMAAKGELKIVGARYDLDSGDVTLVPGSK